MWSRRAACAVLSMQTRVAILLAFALASWRDNLSVMLHLIFCLRRLPHLSREEFQAYWRDHHAPLVKRHADVLGIKRYVQAHSIDPQLSRRLAATRGAPDGYDGVAEIWFDIDALSARGEAALQAGRQLLEDERRFIDLANSPIFVTLDNVVIG